MSAIRTFSRDNLAFLIFFNIHQLCFSVISFIRDAVPAFILTLVDITLLEQTIKDILNDGFVTLLGCANEVIIGDVQLVPQFLDTHDNLIDKSLWRQPFLLSLALNLLAMLIGTCQITHLVSTQTFVTRHCITCYRCVRMPDM
ncbi:hypothetical protein D3C74_393490 [compost metagenome]